MKNHIFLFVILFFVSCNDKQIIVHDELELHTAIKAASSGNEIILANGTWKDIGLIIRSKGTEKQPIIIRAQNKGEVFIEGKSYVKLGGEYIIIKDLYFRNGYSPKESIIQFKINNDTVANNCTVTNCVFYNFNKPYKYDNDHWIEFWGRNNTLSNCYIAGKLNQGPTIRVFLKGNRNIYTYHQIKNNYFASRPRLGGPHGETIQIGSSNTSMTPAYVSVIGNMFEKCNGEIEVISVKSGFNNVEHNIFKYSEGSLVLRHGNYNNINGNIFIGDGISPYYGGIRVINTGHRITNNYFYGLLGNDFRAPLAVMNGIPKSPLNRYNQVTDVVIAYNSWINCISPLQFSVGANIERKDVLPLSEIRSARPERVIVANSLIVDSLNYKKTIVCFDKLDGVSFYCNYINNPDTFLIEQKGFKHTSIKLKEINNFLYVPQTCNEEPKLYNGFEFNKIKFDLTGYKREKFNCYGAISNYELAEYRVNQKYGADWFSLPKQIPPSCIKVHSNDDIQNIIANANPNDTLIFADDKLVIRTPLIINKSIVLKGSHDNKKLFTIEDSEVGFKIFKGDLTLENINFIGDSNIVLFKAKRSARYNLQIKNCTIDGFGYVLEAGSGSFADTISFNNISIVNCDKGIELAAETNERGNYNAEFVNIEKCNFKNIEGNVINYFRGGYDESTIGGNLHIYHSKFNNCGYNAKGSILINTYGIVNVNISNNLFENNHAKWIAILWKEKNCNEINNKIINSGSFFYKKYLKQSLIY